MNMIKKTSIPMSGTMLGIFAMGNLLQAYSPLYKNICGILGAVFLLLLVLNFVIYPKKLLEGLSNPVQAGVLATFTMSLMLLSTYIKPFAGNFAIALWYSAIFLHLSLIIFFSLKFVLNFNIEKVFTTWFIVYVGIAVAGVTAKTFNKLYIGSLSFYFALISLIILLLLVTYRYAKYEVSASAKPLICIYAAPVSLCLAAYLGSVETKSLLLVIILLSASSLILFFMLFKALSMIKREFNPAFSSFTFPFVISTVALKQSIGYFSGLGYNTNIFNMLFIFELSISLCFLSYVYIGFIRLLLKK